MNDYTGWRSRGVLAGLRQIAPPRRLHFQEALRIAELQATALLRFTGVEAMPVPTEVVSELPRLRLEFRDLPTSGLSFWDGHDWVVCLNRYEPLTRRRFTLLHELKHIIDHGGNGIYERDRSQHGEDTPAVKQVADYFAGCVLVPRRHLKDAWAQQGIQRVSELARHFDVSAQAIVVRLAQTGLTDASLRCDRGTSGHDVAAPRYRREQPLAVSTPGSCAVGLETRYA